MMNGVPGQAIDIGVVSHQGRVRHRNEDAYGYEGLCDAQGHPQGWIFVVADGVGGEYHGDQASQMAVQRVIETYKTLTLQHPSMPTIELLEETIRLTNADLYNASIALNVAGHMGTTLVVAVLRPEGVLHAAWVGDSRLYVVSRRLQKIRQVSHDHTEAVELVRQNLISQQQALTHPRRNVLSRSVGGQPETTPEFAEGTLEPTDTIVICSDGLTRYLSSDAIKTLVLQMPTSEQAAHHLVGAANQLGGKDNITALVVHVGPRVAALKSTQPLPDSHMRLSPWRENTRPLGARRGLWMAALLVLLIGGSIGLFAFIAQTMNPLRPAAPTQSIALAATSTPQQALRTLVISLTSTPTVPQAIGGSPKTPLAASPRPPENPSPTILPTIVPHQVMSTESRATDLPVVTDTPSGREVANPFASPIPSLIEPYPNGSCLVTREDTPVYTSVGGVAAFRMPANTLMYIVRVDEAFYVAAEAGQRQVYYWVKPNDGRAGVGWMSSEALIVARILSPEAQAAAFSRPFIEMTEPEEAAAWTLNQRLLIVDARGGCLPLRLAPDDPTRVHVIESETPALLVDAVPSVVEGSFWWRVRLFDGREGWALQSDLETVTSQP